MDRHKTKVWGREQGRKKGRKVVDYGHNLLRGLNDSSL